MQCLTVRPGEYLGCKHKVVSRARDLLGGVSRTLHILFLQLTQENDHKADGDEPRCHKPSNGELLADNTSVSVHCKCLESLNSHAKNREETCHDGDNEETVDQSVLGAGHNESIKHQTIQEHSK